MLKLKEQVAKKYQQRLNDVLRRVIGLSPIEHCNYNCYYCFGTGAANPKSLPTAPPKDLVDFCRNVGRSFVNLTGGGEPMLYPQVERLIKDLVNDGHWLGISTNFAAHDWKTMLKGVPTDSIVLICASYHPPSEDKQALKKQYFEKVLWAKDAGYNVVIKYIVHPTRLQGKLQKAIEEFAAVGLRVLPMPFRGEHAGKTYPKAFTEEERDLICNGLVRPYIFDHSDDFKGKLCHTGYRMINWSSILHPMIYRCNSGGQMSILGGKLKLYDRPMPCEFERCACKAYMREIGMLRGEPDIRHYFWRDRHLNKPDVLRWLRESCGIDS